MEIKSEHGGPQVRPRLIALLATVALLAGCARVPEAPPAVRSHALAPLHGGVLAVGAIARDASDVFDRLRHSGSMSTEPSA
jgi:hypothetical protein